MLSSKQLSLKHLGPLPFLDTVINQNTNESKKPSSTVLFTMHELHREKKKNAKNANHESDQCTTIDIWLYLWILLADSPGRTSCHGIVGLTLELSPTSALSARRNLPAAITCPNISKSIAFHEAAGQHALHTDPTQPSRHGE